MKREQCLITQSGQAEYYCRIPSDYFLENLVVRPDNSIILTVLNENELWYVPAQDADGSVTPIHAQTFEQNATGILEVDPDVLLEISCHFYGEASLRVHGDLRSWSVGLPVHLERFYQFPEEANGEFTIPGLGKLVKAQRAARIGRNPQTGEAIKIKAKTAVKFRVAKAAKDLIAQMK